MQFEFNLNSLMALNFHSLLVQYQYTLSTVHIWNAETVQFEPKLYTNCIKTVMNCTKNEPAN